jgi:DDE superfamily endonuclease
LPSHSTHLLQPLDIGVFQPFKHWHQVALYKAVQYSALKFTKQDFLAAFQRIHKRTFKRKTILSAWEKASLFPFNPALVKSKMAAFQSEAIQVASERPETPPPKPQPFQQTPTTETHQAYMEYLKIR